VSRRSRQQQQKRRIQPAISTHTQRSELIGRTSNSCAGAGERLEDADFFADRSEAGVRWADGGAADAGVAMPPALRSASCARLLLAGAIPDCAGTHTHTANTRKWRQRHTQRFAGGQKRKRNSGVVATQRPGPRTIEHMRSARGGGEGCGGGRDKYPRGRRCGPRGRGPGSLRRHSGRGCGGAVLRLSPTKTPIHTFTHTNQHTGTFEAKERHGPGPAFVLAGAYRRRAAWGWRRAEQRGSAVNGLRRSTGRGRGTGL
jgi:hypothetical protein